MSWGREVATTRILQAVPGFAQQVASCWEALPAELRPRVVGYHPAMLPVLLDETAKLRDVNLRYDARALAEGTQRGTSEAEAREAIRAGRSLGEQTVRIAQRWAPPAYLRLRPLPAQLEGGAANPDVLANGLDAVASWLTGWRGTWSPAEREGYEALQFAPGQADELHGAAARVRETQAVVAAFSDTSPITQRELDAQDGRVLHVVDLIQLRPSATPRAPTCGWWPPTSASSRALLNAPRRSAPSRRPRSPRTRARPGATRSPTRSPTRRRMRSPPRAAHPLSTESPEVRDDRGGPNPRCRAGRRDLDGETPPSGVRAQRGVLRAGRRAVSSGSRRRPRGTCW